MEKGKPEKDKVYRGHLESWKRSAVITRKDALSYQNKKSITERRAGNVWGKDEKKVAYHFRRKASSPRSSKERS